MAIASLRFPENNFTNEELIKHNKNSITEQSDDFEYNKNPVLNDVMTLVKKTVFYTIVGVFWGAVMGTGVGAVGSLGALTGLKIGSLLGMKVGACIGILDNFVNIVQNHKIVPPFIWSKTKKPKKR